MVRGVMPLYPKAAKTPLSASKYLMPWSVTK
jgi:hypothetical protein